MHNIEVIIVAAGSGLRYGAPLPKQFCLLNGQPVVMHTISALRLALPDARFKLVLSLDMIDFWNNLCKKFDFTSPQIITGGSTRWESVRNAVISDGHTAEIIMVHDAVRPLVDKNIIDRLIQSLTSDRNIDGAIPSIAVNDSLRMIKTDGSNIAIDRNSIRAVQTPQAFRGERLRKAYGLPFNASFTDDASVMEAAGYHNIVLTQGSPTNLKITNPGDIDIAEMYAKQSSLQ